MGEVFSKHGKPDPAGGRGDERILLKSTVLISNLQCPRGRQAF